MSTSQEYADRSADQYADDPSHYLLAKWEIW